MSIRIFSLGIAICLGILAMAICSRRPAAAQDQPPKSPSAADVAHGKYLVHYVAQCIQCHTPRDADGELIPTRLLSGAAIPLHAPPHMAPWAAESASISGLGNYDRPFVIYLLTHGQRPDGSQPKHPMPRFKMKQADAEAVVAYLESL